MLPLDPPKPLQSLLPSPKARWVLWILVLLAVGIASLLLWLQADRLLPLEIAQKLGILILPLTLIVIGSLAALHINTEYFKEIEKSLKQQKTKEPDLSQLDDNQSKVLVALSVVPEATAKDISTAIKKTEELVIHILETLEQKLLVRKAHQASVYETGWILTNHGRKYLCDRNLLTNP